MGGARKSPAQKDVTKITVLGLIRPETGTYIYRNACRLATFLTSPSKRSAWAPTAGPFIVPTPGRALLPPEWASFRTTHVHGAYMIVGLLCLAWV